MLYGSDPRTQNPVPAGARMAELSCKLRPSEGHEVEVNPNARVALA